MKRTKRLRHLHVMVSDAELKLFERAAARDDMTLSDWLRRLARREAMQQEATP